MKGVITETKQNRLESLIIRTKALDNFQMTMAKTILVTIDYGSADINTKADSYSVWNALNNLGFKQFKTKNELHKKIKRESNALKKRGLNPKDFFIEKNEVLPTNKGTKYKKRRQKVYEITVLGLMALFVSTKAFKFKMLEVLDLILSSQSVLIDMGNSKFITDLLEDSISLECYVTDGKKFLSEINSLSITEHMEEIKELRKYGLAMDTDGN